MPSGIFKLGFCDIVKQAIIFYALFAAIIRMLWCYALVYVWTLWEIWVETVMAHAALVYAPLLYITLTFHYTLCFSLIYNLGKTQNSPFERKINDIRWITVMIVVGKCSAATHNIKSINRKWSSDSNKRGSVTNSICNAHILPFSILMYRTWILQFFY